MVAIVALAASVALAAAAPAAAQAPAPHCPGDNTVEIDQCMAADLAKADRELARYLAAARQRLKADASDSSDARAALAGLVKAQTAWKAYRKAECDSVYLYWQAGTIRGAMALTCEIDLTRQRTHQVWSQWLTFMDSTPPILPEPPTGTAP